MTYAWLVCSLLAAIYVIADTHRHRGGLAVRFVMIVLGPVTVAFVVSAVGILVWFSQPDWRAMRGTSHDL
jgi:hypothetical protein